LCLAFLAFSYSSRVYLKSSVFLVRNFAVGTLFSVLSVSYAQENTPIPTQPARPPIRTLVDQLSPQERTELRKQLRQHAREHGPAQQTPSQNAPQSGPSLVAPRIYPNSNPNPAPVAPTVSQPNVGNSKDADRLSGIERQQLRAQLREARMREEQERRERDSIQIQRGKGGGAKPNQPPGK
jgi:uncharacterized membrane protein